MDEQLPEGIYFNSPMIVLFVVSGLVLFYFGCCLACCVMYYYRRSDGVEITDVEGESGLGAIDLSSNQIKK